MNFINEPNSAEQSANTLTNNDSSTNHHHQLQQSNEQMHLIMNETFHQNFHTAKLNEQNSFVVTENLPESTKSNESYAFYYNSTHGHLSDETFQDSWNKVEMDSNSESLSSVSVINQNDWYHTQEHDLLTEQNPQTIASESVSLSGSSINKISNDIYTSSLNTFNQFADSQAVVNSDVIPNMHPAITITSTIVSSGECNANQEQSSTSTGLDGANLISTNANKTKTSKKSQRSSKSNNGNKGEARQTKPVSGYALFFRDTQPAIKAENPTVPFGDISKMVASKWELMKEEDKHIYKERADLDKRNYLQNVALNKAKEIALTSSSTSIDHNEISIISNIPQQSIVDSNSNSTANSKKIFIIPNTMPDRTELSLVTERKESQSNEISSASPSLAILDDSLLNDPVNSGTLNSYSTFNYNEGNTYPSTLNSVMNETNAYDSTSQFDYVSSPPFPFNGSEFFDSNTDNMIDLGLDINDFDGINLLNEQISMFETENIDSNTMDFLSPIDQVPNETSVASVTSNELCYTDTISLSETHEANSNNYIDNTSAIMFQSQADRQIDDVGKFYQSKNYLLEASDLTDINYSLLTTDSDSTTINGLTNKSICVRSGCRRPPVDSSQWDREFCSEECCVRYCAEVFRTWTSSKSLKQNKSIESTDGLSTSERSM